MLRTKNCKSPCPMCNGTGWSGQRWWSRGQIHENLCPACHGHQHNAATCDCFARCAHCLSPWMFYVPIIHGPALWCGECHSTSPISTEELTFLSERASVQSAPRAESLAIIDAAVRDAPRCAHDRRASVSRSHDEHDGALCIPDPDLPSVCVVCRSVRWPERAASAQAIKP